MGSEVISQVSGPLPGRGASQPTSAEWSQADGRRDGRSVQNDGPAGVPGHPPDVSGPDDGAADGHHRLPLQLHARPS